MVEQDRFKSSFWALVRAALPRVDYYALRVARVVSQSKDLMTVDFVPDDPKFPSMAGVPLRVTPGSSIELGNGSTVLFGFSEGDPARPFAIILAGGDTPKTITIRADQIVLGGDGAEPAAKGATLQTYLNAIGEHVHSGVTTGAGVSGPSPSLATVPNVQASNVEVL